MLNHMGQQGRELLLQGLQASGLLSRSSVNFVITGSAAQFPPIKGRASIARSLHLCKCSLSCRSTS